VLTFVDVPVVNVVVGTVVTSTTVVGGVSGWHSGLFGT
jgi:hypothetical protein